MIRPIEEVFKQPKAHWVGNGFRVSQYFPRWRPQGFFDRISPFILLDYNAKVEFRGTKAMVGVGPHPHRGFETVTFAFEGKVAHGDNQGNSDVIGPGDIQWMTAGSGILHKEYHEEEYASEDRIFHMIQLWVNLPAKDKMTKPKYQAILKDEMTSLPFDGGNVTIYAGQVKGAKGPASTFSPMNIYKVNLFQGGKIQIEEPEDHNLAMLVIEGEVKLNENSLYNGDFALMENKPGYFELEGVRPYSQVFVLSGQPLNEPVAAGGPFVMNTPEELQIAQRDFNSGAFGTTDF